MIKHLKGKSKGEEKVNLKNSAEEFYMTLENLARVAHAISGGIESPLQFCIQVWAKGNY